LRTDNANRWILIIIWTKPRAWIKRLVWGGTGFQSYLIIWMISSMEFPDTPWPSTLNRISPILIMPLSAELLSAIIPVTCS
jgi:hypothetical protein